MDTIPNGHHSEWISFRRTQSQMDTNPNGHNPKWLNPEWASSRMGIIPNGHQPEWTPSRMDTIPNGHHPEWTPSQMNTIPNEHFHGYRSVVYVCLMRIFYKYAFNEKFIFCAMLVICKNKTTISCSYCLLGYIFISGKIIICIIFFYSITQTLFTILL